MGRSIKEVRNSEEILSPYAKRYPLVNIVPLLIVPPTIKFTLRLGLKTLTWVCLSAGCFLLLIYKTH